MDICFKKQGYHSKANDTKIKYTNELFKQLGICDTKKCVYQIIYNEKDTFDTDIIK